ncbi:MAG TPA: hypothetical protein VGB85_24180, partial [Nannocystis sp.]
DGLPVAREGRVYRRGFISEARVRCAQIYLEPALDHPAWSLLTALDVSMFTDIEREFLTRAPLTRLRRLSGVHAETLESISLPPTVTHVQPNGRLHHCPEGIEALEITTYAFGDLWVFGRQEKHPQLALLSIAAHRQPQGEDLAVIRSLLEPPRPARLVLIHIHRAEDEEPVEVWRLEVAGDTWDFRGDDQVLQLLRELTVPVSDEWL